MTGLGAAEIRQLAHSLDLRPTKALGQNFVHDYNTVTKIVDLSGVGKGDHVLEVGPGLGSLTLGLLEAGATVTAVEIDPRLARLLPETVSRHRPSAALTVLNEDAMALAAVPRDVSALVANLPYNISVPVLIHLMEIAPWIGRVLVMVQAEVGHRIAATPGISAYGGPSVKLAWWGRWKVESTVSRRVFWPEPHVDSVLVGMMATTPPGDEALRRRVFRLVDQGFSMRRKMARQALAPLVGGVEEASALCERAGLAPTDRCEAWGLAEFVELGRAWAVES